jgi:Ser/Thr protein kinase RdoA (MazF antagonist)
MTGIMARMPEEVPLEGGALTPGVVRVGDTVRRPVSNPRAHEVLRFLEAAGFEHAPRFLGIDERGREILSHAAGVTIWPGARHLLGTDATIDRAARLVRRLHDLLPGLVHGDLGTWNVVVDEATDHWTIIDWDEVEEADRTSELAQVLLSFCDLWDGVCPAPAEVARRVRRFADAYGLTDAELLEAVRRIPTLCERHSAAMARRDMREDADMWNRHAAHTAAQLPAWLEALR